MYFSSSSSVRIALLFLALPSSVVTIPIGHKEIDYSYLFPSHPLPLCSHGGPLPKILTHSRFLNYQHSFVSQPKGQAKIQNRRSYYSWMLWHYTNFLRQNSSEVAFPPQFYVANWVLKSFSNSNFSAAVHIDIFGTLLIRNSKYVCTTISRTLFFVDEPVLCSDLNLEPRFCVFITNRYSLPSIILSATSCAWDHQWMAVVLTPTPQIVLRISVRAFLLIQTTYWFNSFYFDLLLRVLELLQLLNTARSGLFLPLGWVCA